MFCINLLLFKSVICPVLHVGPTMLSSQLFQVDMAIPKFMPSLRTTIDLVVPTLPKILLQYLPELDASITCKYIVFKSYKSAYQKKGNPILEGPYSKLICFGNVYVT